MLIENHLGDRFRNYDNLLYELFISREQISREQILYKSNAGTFYVQEIL